jgi:hypothetical protein
MCHAPVVGGQYICTYRWGHFCDSLISNPEYPIIFELSRISKIVFDNGGSKIGERVVLDIAEVKPQS